MAERSKNVARIYQKLVRDRIPEIIRNHGKNPVFREVGGPELEKAVGMKLLEEAHELFNALKGAAREEVLKESADLFEIVLKALDLAGLGMSDLLLEREKRARERGGFSKGIFLECVGDPADNQDVRIKPGFIFSPVEPDGLLKLVKSELLRSKDAAIASAFYSPAILNLLIRDFTQFVQNGNRLRFLFSTMGNINRPDHLSHLQTVIPGVEVRAFHPPELPFDQTPPHFHPKIYLFQYPDDTGSVIIGSANFTEAGFRKNVEWSYFSSSEVNLPFDVNSPFKEAMLVFDRYWNDLSVPISDAFIAGYRKRFGSGAFQWSEIKKPPISTTDSIFEKQSTFGFGGQEEIQPNDAQREALSRLAAIRSQGGRKAAVVAATGIGKTFLAALDFKQSRSKRLLFVAHRENLVDAARESFQKILNDRFFGCVLGGGRNGVVPGSSVFAMVQTLSRDEHLKTFLPDAFDYIVVDEFHHSEAATYKKVLDHFTPAFFLGLTATPERMDGRDVLALCDYNIAFEVRLLEAISRGWLVPFQYYAIYDHTDYDQIAWRGTQYDESELSRALENDTRTAIVASNLRKYLPSTGKIKAIAFCSSISHARYTADTLTARHGIVSVALTGQDDEAKRREIIKRLKDEGDSLKVICTVDIFNEGIDIPVLTHVLFLRPTQSFTVFLQQLGRGLRQHRGKEFLVVLDFIGNFKKAHVAPLALRGYTSTEELIDKVKNWGKTDTLPDCCYLDADIEVQRIWDHEIKRIVDGELTLDERLKALYNEIKEDLGGASPSLLDFVGNSRNVDPYVFIRHFGGWLRTRFHCEDALRKDEEDILGTPAEDFLKHVEMDLNSTRSYKMVVLLGLTEIAGTRWSVDDIAEKFLSHYLKRPERMADYEDLAKSSDPRSFPLSKVKRKLKDMPLKFLSNKDSDHFIFDKKTGMFSPKPELAPFWERQDFRAMVRERAEFGLIRYFSRRANRNEGSGNRPLA